MWPGALAPYGRQRRDENPHVPSDSLSRIDATAVCEDAFAFAYPLVLMELMRRYATSVSAPDPGTMRAPPNRLVHARARPGGGAGTLSSSAWLDLAHGPVVLSVSDTHGRYYVMSLIDMWTSVFASVGARTTGTRAGRYAIGLRGMDGSALPEGVLPITSPTRHVRIAAETCLEPGEGEAGIRAIQDSYGLASRYSRGDPAVADDSAPPADLVDRMDARSFFRLAGRLLTENPPRARDRDVVERARCLGLFATCDDDAWIGDDPELQRAVEWAASRAQATLRAQAASAMGEVWGTWHIDYRRGRFGTDYMCRAAAAIAALGADVPEDSLPALTRTDAHGRRLSGSRRYVLRFGRDTPPPVHGFWALTVAGAGVSLGDRDGLTVDGDGSLPILIQHDRPARACRSNWLPTPPGNFTLVLRLYWPSDEILRRRWTPPPVTLAE
jgi:hypothetical protein